MALPLCADPSEEVCGSGVRGFVPERRAGQSRGAWVLDGLTCAAELRRVAKSSDERRMIRANEMPDAVRAILIEHSDTVPKSHANRLAR